MDIAAAMRGEHSIGQAIGNVSINTGIYYIGKSCPQAAIVIGLFLLPMSHSPNVILPYKEPIIDQDNTRFITYPRLPLFK